MSENTDNRTDALVAMVNSYRDRLAWWEEAQWRTYGPSARSDTAAFKNRMAMVVKGIEYYRKRLEEMEPLILQRVAGE